jgi:hypothetical protein
MTNKKGAIERPSQVRSVSGLGTQKKTVSAARRLFITLLFMLLSVGLNYASSRYDIRGLEQHPWVEHALMLVAKETLRRCERRLKR